MRLPSLPGISARSGSTIKGARIFNVIGDKNNEIAQKRPALVLSEGYGGIGSGLIDSPNGLLSVWDDTLIDEVKCPRILSTGAFSNIDTTGYSNVYICGMSYDGDVCCGYGTRDSDFKIRALRITADGVTELAYPSGISGNTWAYGISGDGLTIVGAGKPSSVGMRSYKWVGSSVVEIARANDSTVAIEGGAMSASEDGNVIVGWHVRSGVRRGYIYKVDTATLTYTTLSSPYNSSTEVKFLCVSADGEWVGGNAAEYPIIWNNTLGILGDIARGTFGFVTGISNRGKYACGYYPLGLTSFFYQREIYQYEVDDLTEPATSASVLTGISIGSLLTNAMAMSKYGNAVICEVINGINLSFYRWNQCSGTFRYSELLGTAPVGSGESVGRTFPKGYGISGSGCYVAATSFSTPSYLRTPTILSPVELPSIYDYAYLPAMTQLFLKTTTKGYYMTGASPSYTVTQISDVDYPATTVRGCVYLDGRFFVMNAIGEIYQSALEDASSWSALEFIASQVNSDAGVFLAKMNNYIMALKEYSIEFFYDAANPTGSILSPVQNMTQNIGCAHGDSVQDAGGMIVWMGQSRNGFGRSIYSMSGSEPQKISDGQIEKILDSDDLSEVYSWSAKVGSHLLYGITLVTSAITLVYDFTTGLWAFFTYLTSSGVNKTVTAVSTAGVVTSTAHGYSDGDIVLIASTNSDFNGWHVATNVTANTFQIQADGTSFSGSGMATKHTETYFPVAASTSNGGKQYMQDISNGNLYEFDQNSYADYIGAIATRVRTPQIDDGTTVNKPMSAIELVGDKIDSTALVRHSDDDYETYSNFRPIKLDDPRPRIRRAGMFRRRAIEVLHVGNALFRMQAVNVDLGG